MHGSNFLPLGPPSDNRVLTRCGTENRSRICQVSFGLDHAACTPCVPPAVQTVQTGPIGGGSQMVQIEIGSGNRCVSYPCLYGHRINSAGQPEAGRRMPQIMDATALRDGGPRQCWLECRSVQSMPRGGDAEEVVGGVRQPTVRDGCYRRPEGAVRQRMRAARKLLFGPVKTAGG
jgi:hypothetical protein